MKIDVLTLFPKMIEGFLEESMIGRARKSGLVGINIHNIRDWARDKHAITDDRPFGGGPGMLMKPEPIFEAIESLREENTICIYMCPDGEKLSPQIAREFSEEEHIIILSGHYEGIDQRVRDAVIDREISIGDYVLTNGTLPAAVLIDATLRYVKGVLGEENSLTFDSFNANLLSFPQYTRPSEYKGMKVPEVLMSGNHKEIESWRLEQQRAKTKERRTDLNIK